jgi:hypothetical protein
VVCILTYCTPSIVLTGAWVNPHATKKPYSNFFVATLTSNAIARSIVESNVTEALTSYGVKATKSIDVFPPKLGKDSIDKEFIMNRVKEKNADGILVCLIRKKTETHYVPGNYGFWGYYSFWYPYVYDPGYYVEDQVYFLDASLYDSSTQDLVWSAQSKSYNSNGLGDFSRRFADLVVKKLISERLLISDPANFKGTN